MHFPCEVKIKHGFEFYHRNKHGYYPSWDAYTNKYSVRTTQNKWVDWNLFFQGLSNESLGSVRLEQMLELYLAAFNHKG
jgi:hypothetical protein